MFVDVIQAAHGDCLLVGSSQKGRRPTRLLIDGGAEDTFAAHLAPVLGDLGGRRILDAVVLSHVDNDHVDGLLDLARRLESDHDNGNRPLVTIRDFWINQYDVSTAGGIAAGSAPDGVHLGIAAGSELTRTVRRLGIPVNARFEGQQIMNPDIEQVQMGPLEITIVGPSQAMLDRLHAEWQKWWNDRAELPTGAVADWDTSVPNRSSVMLLVRQGRHRALLPGDGRGDHLLDGLALAGLLDEDDSIHVDLFKLPHHGSARNISPDVLDRITADTYVLSANGKHDNPDYQTLVWLVESIGRRDGSATLFFTNDTPSLRKLAETHPPGRWGYRIDVLPVGEHVRRLNLRGS